MRYIFILFLFFSCTNQNLKSDIDQKIDDIISQMTLEEKVGQMTQINLIVNSLPRDLLEFVFFLAVGFTAGSVGLI